jgi:deoxyribose-phosphate aldolase
MNAIGKGIKKRSKNILSKGAGSIESAADKVTYIRKGVFRLGNNL